MKLISYEQTKDGFYILGQNHFDLTSVREDKNTVGDWQYTTTTTTTSFYYGDLLLCHLSPNASKVTFNYFDT